MNVVGCIVGPLLAGFWLMPWLGEPVSLLVLASPLFASALVARAGTSSPEPGRLRSAAPLAATALVSAAFFLVARTYESQFEGALCSGIPPPR